MNGEYIITAEYDIFGKNERCLVARAGITLEHAEEVLYRMINNPTENDKRLIRNGKNLEVEFLEERYCWWNDGCD